jgi:phage tail-like protein
MSNDHDGHFQGSFFGLEIKGVSLAYFTGCTGLSVEFDKMEQKSIQNKGKLKTTIKVAGRAKYADVVLKRGFTSNKELMDWFKEVADGQKATPYKDGSIVIYDRLSKEVARFNLLNMWPSKISVSDLNAGQDELMIEEVTMKHELIDWV